MPRPSDALLSFLRDLAGKKGMKTAALSERTGIGRARLRKVMAGSIDMTVDEMLTLLQALEVTPEDMGLPGVPDEAVTDEPAEEVEVDPLAGLDPWGNHPRQLFEAGFTLGCDLVIILQADELSGSGVPEAVLARYAGAELPIRLDAAYHQYMNPRYDESGITLSISFDALYECRFPWTAFRRIVFFPLPPDEPDDDPSSEEVDEDSAAPPFLRLVE